MSAELVSTPPPLPRPPRADLSALRDFPDPVPAMLVKELRQGLRAKVFVSAFLILHTWLVVILLIGNAEGGQQATEGIFWYSVFFVITLLLPLRNLSALSDERRLNTLDTLVLTRLTAWRIVLGKWTSVAAQTSLVAVTIVPYLLVRYLSNGTPLGREALVLWMFLAGGWVFTALLTAVSVNRIWLVRGVITIAGIWVLFAGFAMPLLRVLTDSWTWYYSPENFRNECAMDSLTGLALTFLLLSLGAQWIAPEAENHSTRRRVVCAVFLLISLVVAFFTTEPGFHARVMWSAALILTLTGVFAVTENPERPPVVLAAFSRRKLAGYWLAPGWHTGVLFAATCMALLVLGIMQAPGGYGTGVSDIPVRLCFLLFLPVILLRPFRASIRFHPGALLLTGVLLWVLSLTILLIADLLNSSVGKELAAVMPSPLRIRSVRNGIIAAEAIGSVVLALLVAVPALGKLRAAIRSARQMLSPDGESPSAGG